MAVPVAEVMVGESSKASSCSLASCFPSRSVETMGAPPRLAALLSSATGRQSSTSATQSDKRLLHTGYLVEGSSNGCNLDQHIIVITLFFPQSFETGRVSSNTCKTMGNIFACEHALFIHTQASLSWANSLLPLGDVLLTGESIAVNPLKSQGTGRKGGRVRLFQRATTRVAPTFQAEQA